MVVGDDGTARHAKAAAAAVGLGRRRDLAAGGGVRATGASVLVLLLFAQALTFATHHTVCIALLSHHFPDRLRGRGQALYVVVAYGLPGGLAGGVLNSAYGLVSLYWACTVASLVATGCAFAAWRVQRGMDAAAAGH